MSKRPTSCPEDTDSLVSQLIPIFTREVSLQAHFSFGSQTAGGQRTTQTRSADGPDQPELRTTHHCWSDGKGGHCSVACTNNGMSLDYINPAKHLRKDNLSNSTTKTHCETQAVRSLTFSGRDEVNKSKQKPYDRRCKSTAHIVLKRSDEKEPKNIPHEFHSVPRRDYTKAPSKSDNTTSKNSSDRKSKSDVERPLGAIKEDEFHSCAHGFSSRDYKTCCIPNMHCSCSSCTYFCNYHRYCRGSSCCHSCSHELPQDSQHHSFDHYRYCCHLDRQGCYAHPRDEDQCRNHVEKSCHRSNCCSRYQRHPKKDFHRIDESSELRSRRREKNAPNKSQDRPAF